MGLYAADPGEELNTAARRGNLTDVKKLIEAGTPIESKNQYGATPLYMAVFNGHSEVAMYLLDKGANPNIIDTFYKSSILDSALQKTSPDVAKAMIAKGAQPTVRQLNMVVGSGKPEMLSAVLTAKLKPEELTEGLKAAIATKKDDMAAVLRKAGAPEPKAVSIPPETLARYAGDYVSDKLPLGIKVSVDGGSLKGQADGQPEFALSADSPTEFSFAMAGVKMVFDGKDGFVLHQAGQQFPYVKKGSANAPAIRKVPEALMANYTGVYAAPGAPLEITVSNADGQVAIQASGQPRVPLKLESDTEFSFSPAGLRLTFDGKGSFVLSQGGKDIKFTKKEAAK